MWSVANDDLNSGKIGVSAYDFTGDGIDEVLVQDRLRMRILDGQTGRVMGIIANSSGTLWEYPVVADLEGNNNASLIMVANDYDRESQVNHGVFVYESANPSKPCEMRLVSGTSTRLISQILTPTVLSQRMHNQAG